jgi:tetratricopeptide (TPR) repeat protein
MVIEAQSKKLRLEDLDRNNGSTGILGRMTAFEMFPRIKAEYRWPVDPISESALVHVRVLIGYDDVKRTVSLHDPSLGPRREISYDDFTKMWKAFGNGYIAAYPNDYLSRPAKRSASPAYRSPTTDEQAAAYFLQGYALSSIGKPAAAEEQFRRGLALPGLGKGYRHLFLLELASALYSRAHSDEAVSAAEQAITLLPESSLAWSFLGRVYPQSSVNDAKKKGKDAARKAQMLAGSRSALKTVAAALPRNFFIPYLGEVRGWAGETLRLP